MCQIFTDQVPFHESRLCAQVILRVHNGEMPGRPSMHGLSDGVWAIIEACWSRDPQGRLTAGEAVNRLRSLPGWGSDTRPAGNWDRELVAQVRSSVGDHPFPPPVQHLEAALRDCSTGGAF
jgi:hypothetical protein